MPTDVIILCGGLGTRLRSVVKNVPKPLADINGKPFLDVLIDHISLNKNVGKIILAAGYKGEQIKKRFTSEPNNRKKIEVIIENEPLGTGGAIRNSLSNINTDNFIVINGDSFINQSLDELISYHLTSKKKITITIKHKKNTARYGLIELDKTDMTVNKFLEKDDTNQAGYINSGIYVMDKKWASKNLVEKVFSIEEKFQDIIEEESINCFLSNANFIDIGTVKSYNEAQTFFNQQEHINE